MYVYNNGMSTLLCTSFLFSSVTLSVSLYIVCVCVFVWQSFVKLAYFFYVRPKQGDRFYLDLYVQSVIVLPTIWCPSSTTTTIYLLTGGGWYPSAAI